MEETTTHIDNLKTLNKDQSSLIWILEVFAKTLNSALFDAHTQSIVWLQSFTSNSNISAQQLNNAKQAIANFKITKTIVGISEDRILVLPNDIIDADAQKNALALLHSVAPTDWIKTDTLPWQKMYVCYALKHETGNTLNDLHSNVQVCNISSAILYQALQHTNTDKNKLFIHYLPNAIIISAVKDSILQVHNHYALDGALDAVYHLAKCQNSVDMQQAAIYVSGHGASEQVPLLSEHFANCTLQDMPKGVRKDMLNDSNLLNNYSLYSLINLCV